MLNRLGKACDGCDTVKQQLPGENPEFNVLKTIPRDGVPEEMPHKAALKVERCAVCGRIVAYERRAPGEPKKVAA